MVSIGSMNTGEIKAPWEVSDIVNVDWSVAFFIEVNNSPVDFFSLPIEYQKHILNEIAQGEDAASFCVQK